MATPMRKNSIYVRVYILWMNLFVQVVIPFITLITLNSIIYTKIKEFEKRSRTKSPNSQNQLRVSFACHHSTDITDNINASDNWSFKSTSSRMSLSSRRHRRLSYQPSSRSNLSNNDVTLNRFSRETISTNCDADGLASTAHQYSNGLLDNGIHQSDSQTGKSCKRKNRINQRNSLKTLEEDGVQETKENLNGKQSVKVIETDSRKSSNDSAIDIFRTSRKNSDFIEKRKNRKRCQSLAHIMHAGLERKSSVDIAVNRFRKLEKSLNVVTTRRRELALAKVSLYIVFVMLLCHSVRLIPNTYEMIQTYTQVRITKCEIYIINVQKNIAYFYKSVLYESRLILL